MQRLLKRLMDLAFSGIAFVLLTPVLVIIVLLIWLVMGRPILFSQTRAGYQGTPFRLLKFRTMADTRDAQGRLLSDGERLTRLGNFVRRYSLDELPQLWNVLRGQMSLVGPRPLLADYLPRYSQQQARRHEVKPGVTGWAQVNGRNALSWDRKFELDVWYVDHWCLVLDAKILWETIRKVFRREGISSDNHATMPEFTGNNQRSS